MIQAIAQAIANIVTIVVISVLILAFVGQIIRDGKALYQDAFGDKSKK